MGPLQDPNWIFRRGNGTLTFFLGKMQTECHILVRSPVCTGQCQRCPACVKQVAVQAGSEFGHGNTPETRGTWQISVLQVTGVNLGSHHRHSFLCRRHLQLQGSSSPAKYPLPQKTAPQGKRSKNGFSSSQCSSNYFRISTRSREEVF